MLRHYAIKPRTADGRYYDSIYTERYLGLLPQNLQNYKESSPIENAAKLKGKLLICAWNRGRQRALCKYAGACG